MIEKILAPISVGELLDKITILELKQFHTNDDVKLHNINVELGLLINLTASLTIDQQLIDDLRNVNKILWAVEDELRIKEKKNEFDSRFIELARLVYKTNDRRAEIKKQINLAAGSLIIEEKVYQ